jgi:hypothetical protein
MKQQNKHHRRRASRNHNLKNGYDIKISKMSIMPVFDPVAPNKDKWFYLFIFGLMVIAILLIITAFL